MYKRISFLIPFLFISFQLFASTVTSKAVFPLAVNAYHDQALQGIGKILWHRIQTEPLNLIATIIFICAIIHTFFASKVANLVHHIEHKHAKQVKPTTQAKNYIGSLSEKKSILAELLHYAADVEVVFGLWAILLLLVISLQYGMKGMINYVAQVDYTEPMFVVVIMSLANTRAVLRLIEQILYKIVRLGKETPLAWWFAILTITPLLGSFITEPAAMTLAALLLAKQFYDCKPSPTLAYATIGLLFVDVSVGGTLSHFAAPPVLMVAKVWNWDMLFMLTHFGWKAVIGIVISNSLYAFIFRGEFSKLKRSATQNTEDIKAILWEDRDEPIPVFITLIHLALLAWTVYMAHYPALFIAGFLFFIGFHKATLYHQNSLNLKSPLLVGFFLAGLVTHGKAQGWWLVPILGNLHVYTLMIGSTILTAFNDNATITYLTTLVPDLSPALKYAVVVGAVSGGGLTIIANAPNPAGQTILKKFFNNQISPLKLLLAALIPTIIVELSFVLL